MRLAELIEELQDLEVSGDPDVTLWSSETEKAYILSIYTDDKKKKVFIDISLD